MASSVTGDRDRDDDGGCGGAGEKGTGAGDEAGARWEALDEADLTGSVERFEATGADAAPTELPRCGTVGGSTTRTCRRDVSGDESAASDTPLPLRRCDRPDALPLRLIDPASLGLRSRSLARRSRCAMWPDLLTGGRDVVACEPADDCRECEGEAAGVLWPS